MPGLLATLLAWLVVDTDANALTTVQVNLLYRHGDRSSERSFPKDVNKESAWPQGYGQLSQIGMQQHYELGGYLKRRYKSLLSATYVNSEISVRSTDFDRTLMSAYSNLAGLYQPNGSQVWDLDVKWQPVPVHTVPVESDILLGRASCTRYNNLVEELRTSREVVDMNTRYAAFFKTLSDLSGEKIIDVFSVSLLYDTIYCEQQHNLSIPSWWQWVNITGDTHAVNYTMSVITDFYYKIIFDSKEKQRLIAGTLVGQIRQNMDAMANYTTGTAKMYMYSAHDGTVAALLSALNVYDGKKPRYTATVMVELLRNDSSEELFVSIYYKNGVTVKEPVALTIPGCENPCPLSKFKSLTDSVVPADWNNECRNQVSSLTLIHTSAWMPSCGARCRLLQTALLQPRSLRYLRVPASRCVSLLLPSFATPGEGELRPPTKQCHTASNTTSSRLKQMGIVLQPNALPKHAASYLEPLLGETHIRIWHSEKYASAIARSSAESLSVAAALVISASALCRY